jgi:hypothetical protein
MGKNSKAGSEMALLFLYTSPSNLDLKEKTAMPSIYKVEFSE